MSRKSRFYRYYRRLRLILGLALLICLLSLWSSPSSFPAFVSTGDRTNHRVAARKMQDYQALALVKPDLCHDWTSDVANDDDPKGCMRAIKYRQVESLSKDLLHEMT